MMKTDIIEAFTDNATGMRFCGATAFTTDEDTVALFEKHGHLIVIPKFQANLLKEHKLDLRYLRKMKSRGFVEDTKKDSGQDCCMAIDGCSILPEFFMVDVTKQCNMHCQYCLRDINTVSDSISPKILDDICKYITEYCDINNLPDLSVQAWGGEPLLKLDALLAMRKKIAPARTRVHFSIETNALLLTPETLKILYDNRIGIGISIDGDSTTHDLQRVFPGGGGTHTIVEKNLLAARRLYGPKIGTITTVTRNNALYVEKILEYFAVQLHLENVKFNFVHQSSFNECKSLCLSKEEIADVEVRILNKLVELVERGYRIFENNLKIKLNNLLYRKYSDVCHSRGCCGGRKMVVISMDGGIYPCELTDSPQERIGSIYEPDSLLQQLERAKIRRDFYVKKTSEDCMGCPWYVFCGGGCTVRTITTGKRPPAIDEIECAVNKTVYPALMEVFLTKPKVIETVLQRDHAE